MTVDTNWALAEFDKFLALVKPNGRRPQTTVRSMNAAAEPAHGADEAIQAAQVVEMILDRVLPNWRTETQTMEVMHYRWAQHIEAIQRAQVLLRRKAELDEKLGDDAPRLNAAHLHPWIWDSARSLWQSGHYRDAVRNACVQLNAETQNKVGRRDVSEAALFNEAFTLDAPKAGKPRLRVMADDGSATYQSIHRGIRAYADGCYSAIRNPISHTTRELHEEEALEQLAALSVLARWVDAATLDVIATP